MQGGIFTFEFDDYIKSIIDNLQVSKKKKAEMFDEYRDHLTMLKQDYIKNGLKEEVAIEEAIKSFGNNENLKALFNNIFGYRTITNILSGIFVTILLFILGTRISWTSLNVNSVTVPDAFRIFIPYTLMFIPVGYFLPIIFKRAGKNKNIALASLLLSTITGLCLSVPLGSLQVPYITNLLALQITLIVSIILGGLLGSLLGFIFLKMISMVTLKCKHSYSK